MSATLRITRTQFTGQSNPAIDVTWDAPTLSGNVTEVANYEVKLLKHGTGRVGTNLLQGADDRTATLTGLDAGATYTVHVRAQLKVNGDWQWNPNWAISNNVNANRPPTALAHTISNTTLEDIGGLSFPLAVSDQTNGDKDIFSDPDGDALTYWVSSQYPGIISAKVLAPVIEGTWTNISLKPHNPGKSKITYGVRDAYGGSVSASQAFTVVWNLTRSVDENSPAGDERRAPR